MPDRAPFVGRAAELAALEDGLSSALGGRGRLFLLGGEAGIGKTVLADELASRASARGAGVLWGRCWEGEAAPPFWPWTQILRAYARATPPDILRSEVSPGADDLARIEPSLNPDSGSDKGEAPAILAEGHFRLFDSMALFLRRAAARQPLLLVFDDLHAADESSLQLLRFCARELVDTRVLALGAFREAEVRLKPSLHALFGDLGREAQRLTLGGLSVEEVAACLRLQPGTRFDETLAGDLHRLTEGNPFFVDQIAREIGAGRLRPEALRPGAGLQPIPDDVREAIRRRLATLPAETRRLLELASVIGREFDAPLLAHLVRADTSGAHPSVLDLAERLEAAVRSATISSLDGGVARYAFTHTLVCDTLRADLPRPERLSLHLVAATALESGPSGEAAGARALAHHFCEAASVGGAEKAVQYAQRAGDEARVQAAHDDAAAQYGRALEALRFLPADPRRRAVLLLAVGDAERCAGRIPAARDAFRRAAELARDLGDRELGARAALGFAHVGETGAVDRELVSLLEDALERLGTELRALRAQLLARLAMALYFSVEPADRQRRQDLSLEALDLARVAADPAALGAVLVARHFVLWGPGTTAERLAISAELVRLAGDSGDVELELEGRLWRTVDLLESDDPTGYRSELARFCERAELLRLPSPRWHVQILAAMEALARGDLAGSEAAAASARALGERYHIERAPQFFGALLFHVRRAQGRMAEIEPAVRAFAEQFAALPVWRCGLALLFAEIGRDDEARRAYERALATDPATWPADGSWLPSLTMLAEVAAHLRDREGAAKLQSLLAPHAGTQVVLFDGIALLGPVDYFLGLLSRTMGDEAAAQRWLLAAQSSCERLGATALAERARLAASGVALEPPAAGASRAAAPASARIFRSEGAYWAIAFGGVESRLKHSRGLSYIAHLLRHPGEEFHALELSSVVADPRKRQGEPVAPGRLGGTAVEILDAPAVAAYRRRLRELAEELAEAEGNNDLGQIERLRHESHALTTELSRALGLGGRSRLATSDAERARIAVTKAIGLALRAVGEQSPELRLYLGRTIRTGVFCGYHEDPQEAGTWET